MIYAKFYFPDGSTTIRHGISYIRRLHGISSRGQRPIKVVFTGECTEEKEREIFRSFVYKYVSKVMHPRNRIIIVNESLGNILDKITGKEYPVILCETCKYNERVFPEVQCREEPLFDPKDLTYSHRTVCERYTRH